ncbi:unnamed protein product [Boreogadus saida]
MSSASLVHIEKHNRMSQHLLPSQQKRLRAFRGDPGPVPVVVGGGPETKGGCNLHRLMGAEPLTAGTEMTAPLCLRTASNNDGDGPGSPLKALQRQMNIIVSCDTYEICDTEASPPQRVYKE